MKATFFAALKWLHLPSLWAKILLVTFNFRGHLSTLPVESKCRILTSYKVD